MSNSISNAIPNAPSPSETAALPIVIAGFGSTYTEAYNEGIQLLQADFKAWWPDHPLWDVMTATQVRAILQARGVPVLTLQEALDQVKASQPHWNPETHPLPVLALHIIEGHEYARLRLPGCLLSRALLARPSDLQAFVDRVIFPGPQAAPSANIPYDPSEGVLLMGHGTSHGTDHTYDDLAALYEKRNASRASGSSCQEVHLATVEGSLTLDAVLPKLLQSSCTSWQIRPLMFVAGDHAHNDLAGEEPSSWVNRLQAAGLKARPVLEGLGTLPTVRALYREHLAEVFPPAKS